MNVHVGSGVRKPRLHNHGIGAFRHKRTRYTPRPPNV
jgi:hypothetical protein